MRGLESFSMKSCQLQDEKTQDAYDRLNPHMKQKQGSKQPKNAINFQEEYKEDGGVDTTTRQHME